MGAARRARPAAGAAGDRRQLQLRRRPAGADPRLDQALALLLRGARLAGRGRHRPAAGAGPGPAPAGRLHHQPAPPRRLRPGRLERQELALGRRHRRPGPPRQPDRGRGRAPAGRPVRGEEEAVGVLRDPPGQLPGRPAGRHPAALRDYHLGLRAGLGGRRHLLQLPGRHPRALRLGPGRADPQGQPVRPAPEVLRRARAGRGHGLPGRPGAGAVRRRVPGRARGQGRRPVMLSARDVEEALKERLLRGAYPRGGALPSVRALAAELGTSPSTVGRAVQVLARQGWVTATSRRGAVVRRDLPAGETDLRDAEAAIRRLAVRWRLVGGDRVEFQELVARVADEVFQPAPRTVFLECNPVDLQRGLEQVQRETSVSVEPLLLEDAADGSGELLKDANVLLTPYFHLAEARELAPEGAQVVPLNFVPSEDAMRALVELTPETLVGVLAVDARSRRRLEAIVQQYSAATVLGALLDDPEAAASLVGAADVVLITNAANLPGHLAARARRLVRVGWALEPGGLGGWRVSAEPSSGAG